MDISQARRLETPRWINVRTVAGLLIFSLAFLGATRTLSGQRTTTTVWVTAHDLPTGAALSSDDLVAREVRLPAGQLNLYALTATDLVGGIVTRPLQEGELVPLAGVAASGDVGPGRSITIPIEVEHAVGGSLVVGDLIDVFATFTDRRGKARTVRLVSGVEVIDVVTAGGLVADEASVGVTVSVSPDDSARLALAIRTGAIDVVRIDAPSISSSTTEFGEDDL